MLIAILGGLFFATWQLTARTSSNTPMVLNIGMTVGALIASIFYGSFVMKQAEWQSLTSTNVWLPLFCGVLNGIGFILYLAAMQKSPSLTAVSIASMMSMIGFIAIGSIILFRDPLTFDKVLGVCAAAIAVYLLSK